MAALGLLPLALIWLIGFVVVSLLLQLVAYVVRIPHVDVVTDGLVLWTAAGFLMWNRRVEKIYARLFMKYRPPTASDLRILDAAWGRVMSRANLAPGEFDLWIEDSPSLNAAAVCAHTVAVTSGALDVHPKYLEAVLAHEYGHHVGGHTRISSLRLWYLQPVRLAYAIPFLHQIIWTIMGASASLSRTAEYRADATAVHLGYGPDLVELFTVLLQHGQDGERKSRSLTDRVFASHPPLDKRIARMNELLGTCPANEGPPDLGTFRTPNDGGGQPADPMARAAAGFSSGPAASPPESYQPSPAPASVPPGCTTVLYDLSQWDNERRVWFVREVTAAGVPSDGRGNWLAVHPAAVPLIEAAMSRSGVALPPRRTE